MFYPRPMIFSPPKPMHNIFIMEMLALQPAELASINASIRELLSSHQGSIQRILAESSASQHSIEDCLELMVHESNRKQTDLNTLADTCLGLVQKMNKLQGEQQILINKLSERDEMVQKLQLQNSELLDKNYHAKEELKQYTVKLANLETAFERERTQLKEEINEQIENYISQMSRQEQEKFEDLRAHIKELEEAMIAYEESFVEHEDKIVSLNEIVGQLESENCLLKSQVAKFKGDYIQLQGRHKILSNDNEILCKQIQHFYKKSASSTTNELASVGSLTNFRPDRPAIGSDNDSDYNDDNLQEEDRKIPTREEDFLFRVKSLERLSSVASFMNLADLNFDGMKASQKIQQVSIGVGPDRETRGYSPITALDSSPTRDMASSMVIARFNSEDMRVKMTKKPKKLEMVDISQCVEPQTPRSFISTLVSRRTHKTKPQESILQMQQRQNKSTISLTNNSVVEKLVSSRIRKKNTNNTNKSMIVETARAPSFMDSLCNLVVKRRIKK